MNVVQNLVIKGFQPEACLVRIIKSLLFENKTGITASYKILSSRVFNQKGV